MSMKIQGHRKVEAHFYNKGLYLILGSILLLGINLVEALDEVMLSSTILRDEKGGILISESSSHCGKLPLFIIWGTHSYREQ